MENQVELSSKSFTSYLGHLVDGQSIYPSVRLLGPDLELARSLGASNEDQYVGTKYFKNSWSNMNLLLRLFNETYISLPIINCRGIKKIDEIKNGDYNIASEYDRRDACAIDWKNSKLLVDTIDSIVGEKQFTSEFFLEEISNSSLFIERNVNDNLTSSHQLLDNYLKNNQSNNSVVLEHNLFKSVYLSASSILAICGILTNLFIVTIIIFSARQKSNTTTRGSSNSNRTNPLLIQLTITGLLLASYVLVDNFLIFNEPVDSNARQDHNFKHPNKNLHQDRNMCRPVDRISPTISSLFMPNIYDSFSLELSNIQQRTSIRYFFQKPIDQDSHLHSGRFLLNLKFKDSESQFNPRERISSDSTIILYRNESHTGPPKYLDLSSHIDSVSLIESQCQQPEIRQSIDQNQTETANPQIHSYTHTLFNKSAPLLVNLVASIYLWTIAALAYDRFCAVANPLQYLRSTYTTKFRMFLALLWIASIFINLILPTILDNYNMAGPQLNLTAEYSSPRTYWIPTHRSNQDDDRVPPIQNDKHLNNSEPDTNDCRYSSILMAVPCERYTDDDLFNIEPINRSGRVGDSYGSKIALMLVGWVIKSYDYQEENIMPEEFKWYNGLVVAYSIFEYLLWACAPLIIIITCNARIYGIVMVHERRLSTNSGSNIGNSITHLDSQNKIIRKSQSKSLTSVIGSNFAKFRATGKSNLETPTNTGYVPRSDWSQCESRETWKDSENSTMIHRSRRLVAREDSYQIIARLKGEDSPDFQISSRSQKNDSTKETSEPVEILTPIGGQKQKLKRKSSDQRLTFAPNQKDTNLHCDHMYPHGDYESDICSVNEQSRCSTACDKYDSSSIMNQLKLAGLSFAGVAINDNLVNSNQRALTRASSCSLGNLSNNHCYLNHTQSHCFPRSSTENVSTTSACKKSYATLIAASRSRSQDGYYHEGYTTRLLDSGDQESNAHHNCNSSINSYATHLRLPYSIGTKSVAFNVLIWLILTMFFLSFANFMITTITQLEITISSQSTLDPRENETIKDFLKQYHLVHSSRDIGTLSARIFRISAVWLSCLIRILFTAMISLNGWLYGIRSRSLKVKIRMVLKRYISRRQASIEINQRQRSVSSMRSRNSSLTSHPACTYYNVNGYHNHGYQESDKLGHRYSGYASRRECKHLPVSNKSFIDCLVTSSARDGTAQDPEVALNLESALGSKLVRSGQKTAFRDSREHDNTCGDTLNLSCKAYIPNDIVQESSHNSSLTECNAYFQSENISSSTSITDSPICIGNRRCRGDSSRVTEHSSISKRTMSFNVLHHLESNRLGNLFDYTDPNSISYKSQSETHVKWSDSPAECKIRTSNNVIENTESNVTSSRRRSHSFSHADIEQDMVERVKIRVEDMESSCECDGLEENNSLLLNIDSKKHMSLSGGIHEFSKNPIDTYIHIDESSESVSVGSLSQSIGTASKSNKKSIMDWCKSLREVFLIKLVNTSIGFVAGNFMGTESSKENSKNSSIASDVTYCTDSRIDFMPAQDQNHIGQHYKATIDSSPVSMWRSTSLNNQIRSSFKSNLNKNQSLSNSQTIISNNNLEDNSIRQTSDENMYRSISDTCSETDQQSTNYLKPPQFLKLIFDSDMHKTLYSGPLALSPIKECSSNHSYASSLSSLDHQAKTNVWLMKED